MAIMLLTGVALRRLGVANDKTMAGASNIVYNVFLPSMIIYNIYNSGNALSAPIQFYALSLLGPIVIMVFSMLWAGRALPLEDRSAFVCSVVRSNNAIYGIPLAMGLLGEAGVPDMVALVVPGMLVMNMLAVVICVSYGKEKRSGLMLIKDIAASPVVAATLVGILLHLLPITLPPFILSALSSFSAATTPVAFIALGASFTFSSSFKHRRLICLSMLLKLIVVPAVMLSLGVFVFGMRGVELVTLICLFATPTAATVGAMVRAYGGNHVLGGEIVAFSTVSSILTVFLFVLGLRFLGVLA